MLKVPCAYLIKCLRRKKQTRNVNQFNISLFKGFGGGNDEEPITGTGADLEFEAGDIVVSSLIPNPWFVSRPHQYYYAISNSELVSFRSSLRNTYTKMYPKVLRPKEHMNKVQMKLFKTKGDPVGLMGRFVARMMVGTRLYYSIFSCNDKHYAKYLAFGAVSNRWKDDMLLRVSRKCPVRAPLNQKDFARLKTQKTFTLLDADHGETTLSVAAWKQSKLWSDPRTFKVRWHEPVVTAEHPIPAREYQPPDQIVPILDES